MVCSVCVSPERATVERLADETRTSVREIARTLGLPYDPVVRHLRKHKRVSGDLPARGAKAPGRRVRRAPVAVAGGAAVSESAVETFTLAFGMQPMPHQVDYLSEAANLVFLKGRQVGATQSAAALAIHVARESPSRNVIIVSPSQKQSTEVAVRARNGLWQMGEKLLQDSSSLLRLQNDSRIMSLAGTPRAVRGYSADLLIVDEAAYVDDQTWDAARPTVAATGGRVVVQSTPYMPTGFFHDLSVRTPPGWRRLLVRSDEAGTIDPEFLARERAEMTPVRYANEYEGRFASADLMGAWFDADELRSRVAKRDEGDDSPGDTKRITFARVSGQEAR